MWNLAAAIDGVEGVRALLLAWGVVFAMNVVTYPLPPAWMVLAAFHTYTDVPLLPLTIGGSAAAALGRMLFAWQAKTFTHQHSLGTGRQPGGGVAGGYRQAQSRQAHSPAGPSLAPQS